MIPTGTQQNSLRSVDDADEIIRRFDQRFDRMEDHEILRRIDERFDQMESRMAKTLNEIHEQHRRKEYKTFWFRSSPNMRCCMRKSF